MSEHSERVSEARRARGSTLAAVLWAGGGRVEPIELDLVAG